MTSARSPGPPGPDRGPGTPAAGAGPDRGPGAPPAAGAGHPRWHPSPGPRVTSWLVDWLVVGAWLAVLTLGGFLLRGLWAGQGAPDPTPRTLLVTDLLVSLGTVVPYVIYLSLTESSRARATLGKRVGRLVVAEADGGRAPAGSVWVRNLVKASPWQLAHLGVSRAVLDLQMGWAWVFVLLSLVVLAACAVPSLVGGRGLHDRAAGTRVERAPRNPVTGRPGSEGR